MSIAAFIKQAAMFGVRLNANRLATDVIAHRGGGALVMPENSMSAYQASAAAGLRNIEQDVYLLSDGSLGCMHDTTVDRTTGGTGNTTSFNADTFKALALDPKTYLAPGHASENCVLFTEVLRELAASNCVIWPEAKNAGAGAAIVAALARHNWPKNRAVVQSFTLSDLAPAIAAGYGAALGGNAAGQDWAALKAAGVTYYFAPSWTAAQVTAAKGAGLVTVVYTLNRRRDWAAAKAAGVDMVFSDDPLWTSGVWAPLKRDTFWEQIWTPGMYAGKGSNRGGFLGNGAWGYADETIVGYLGALQGWACPIKSDSNAATFTISATVNITAVNGGDTSRHADVLVCSNTDAPFADSGVECEVSGYNILVRPSGFLQIYKQPIGGAATQIASVSGAALTLGTNYTLTITVTPTAVTAALSNGTTVSANDTTYRGGYFHFGRNGAAVKYGNVVVS